MAELLAEGGGAPSEESGDEALEGFDDPDGEDLDAELGEDVALEGDEAPDGAFAAVAARTRTECQQSEGGQDG